MVISDSLYHHIYTTTLHTQYLESTLWHLTQSHLLQRKILRPQKDKAIIIIKVLLCKRHKCLLPGCDWLELLVLDILRKP